MRVLDMLREAAMVGDRNDSSNEGNGVMARPPLAERAVAVLQGLIDVCDAKSAEWRANSTFNGLGPPVREGQNSSHPFAAESRSREQEAAGKTHGAEREEEDELMSDHEDDDGGPPRHATSRHPVPPQLSSSSHWRATDARPSHPESHASSSSKPDVVSLLNGLSFDLSPFYDSTFILDPSSMLDPSFGFDASFMDVSFS